VYSGLSEDNKILKKRKDARFSILDARESELNP